MAYSSYLNSAALQGTIAPNMTPPAGEAAGVAWLKNGENAEQAISNRPHKAIADNCDILKERLDVDIAVTQTAALAAFSGNTIGIDPTGAALGDINFTGTVYLGTGYANNQENRDTLFQFLDENYNEVSVDGAEVKVSAVGGGAVGGGFYSAGVVVLTLSGSVPAGNYRLRYSIGSSLATLPDDAFITADIRGVHEAAEEANYKAVYVVAADSTRGPADFVGADAVQKALATLDGVGNNGFVLLVRRGTYTITSSGGGAELTIDENNVAIIGEGSDDAAGEYVEFQVDTASSHDINISGANTYFKNIKFTGTGAAGREIIIFEPRATFEDCYIDTLGVSIESNAQYTTFKNCRITTDDTCVTLDSTEYAHFLNCNIVSTSNSGTNAAVRIGAATASRCITFDSCKIGVTGSTSSRVAIELQRASEILFRGCEIFATSASAIKYGNVNQLGSYRFENCYIRNTPSTAGGAEYGPIVPNTIDTFFPVQMTLSGCRIITTGSWYKGPFVQLWASDAATYPTDSMPYNDHGFIKIDNCYFADAFCKGSDTVLNPPTTAGAGSTTPFPVFQMYNAIGSGLVFDRSSATYDIQDSSWMLFSRCDVSDVKVVYPDINAKGCFKFDGAVSAGTGIIEVSGGVLRNAKIIGWVGSGSTGGAGKQWQRPILYASSFVSVGIAERALVDGFDIVQLLIPAGADPYEWESSYGYLIALTYATLRRFTWNSHTNSDLRNMLDSTVPLTALADLTLGGIVEDCDIYHDTTGQLLDAIFASTNNDGSIMNCRIKLDDPGNAAVGLARVLDGTSNNSNFIRGNYINITGTPATGSIIYVGGGIVTNNYVGTNNGGAHTGIQISGTAGNSVVSNNVLKGGGAAPGITGGTVGVADNAQLT